ncbi:MAG: TatD family hydrolase [Candidatus Nanoarchaeia archaeon]|nr:TatD family hydrolase [Candidatus Nanoarchaeia archaeon]MDD5740591.1 TatD family hydrolase [Candidatus Nanoarchaeia archaeon]
MKKIDIHVHATNRKVLGVLPKSCSVDYIAGEMKKYEIEKSAVLASYFPHKTSGISNFRLLHWIKDRPEFYLFGSLDFKNYFMQGMNELNELAEMNHLDGIKIYTCYQEIDIHSPKMKEVVKIAKKFNIPLVFHCGYSHSSLRKYGKPAITKMVKPTDLEFLARENPEVNFLAAHMGNPFFGDVIKAAKRNPNFYTDMSGLISSKHNRKEIPKSIDAIKKFLQESSTDKLLFGTDFPVQTHEDSIYMVESAMKNCADSCKQKVYYDNARRFLKK